MTGKAHFEWEDTKNQDNQKKHGISFAVAQYAITDENHIIIEDFGHSESEKRYNCIGKSRGRSCHREIHISEKCYSHFWCRILKKWEIHL
jgi:uncharacterized DUF497 family protein